MSNARPFDDFYEPVTEAGCWLWMGSIDSKGYGGIKVDGKQMGAHRRSWVLANGPIPDRLHVLHKCDTPSCVNPSHLFLGTNYDNVQDMVRKGRARGGNGAYKAPAKPAMASARDKFIEFGGERKSIAEWCRVLGLRYNTVKARICNKGWAHERALTTPTKPPKTTGSIACSDACGYSRTTGEK